MPADTITPDQASQLAALGWISPGTAASLGATTPGGGAQATVLPAGGSVPLMAQPASPAQLAANASQLGAAGISTPIPGITAPIGGAAPGGAAPVTTPYNSGLGNSPPPGGWPAGTGNAHAGGGPFALTPENSAAAQQARAWAAIAPAPGAAGASSADLANPSKPPAPPGSLLGDRPGETGNVSIPMMHRDEKGLLQPGPLPVTPGAAGGPRVGGVGGGAPATGKPGEPKPLTATQEWLNQLEQQQRDAATRGVLLDDAIKKKADAESAKAIAVQAGTFEATQQAKDRMQQEAAARQSAMKDADEADAQSKQRAIDLGNRKIDPMRVWHNASVPQQILGALAMAFGAFGAALAKTPNFAMQMIQGAVDRDIDAQKTEIQNAKDSNAELAKLSREKYGRAMDQQTFDAHQRLDAYNYAMQQVDASAKTYDSDVASANADVLRQQLQGEVAQQKMGIAQNIYTTKRNVELVEEQKRQAAANAQYAAYAAQQKRQQENQKLFRDFTAKFMEGGDDLNTARARALSLMAPQLQTGNIGPLPGKPGEGPGAKRQLELGQQQQTFDASTKNLEDMKTSPVLSEIGFGTEALGSMPRIFPGNAQTINQVNSLNLQMFAAAGRSLKDTEGRIPPAMLEQLHKFEISPTDTQAQAVAKIQGVQDFLAAQAGSSGVNAPAPNAPYQPPAYAAPGK